MMMSVGVEMTSYLSIAETVRYRHTQTQMHPQLDDVGMSKRPHIFHLPLYPRLGLGHIDDLLRDELHGNPMASDGMHGHFERHKYMYAEATGVCTYF